MPESSSKDLRKLTLVPVLAVKGLCNSKTLPDQTVASINSMSLTDLLTYVRGSDLFSQVDIDRLYETYRYGRRLSLQLYLIPIEHRISNDADAVYAIFSAELERLNPSAPVSKEGAPAISVEYNHDVRLLQAVDKETFGNLLEFRYKYQMPITYLDENEEVSQVYETRYGFVWMSFEDQFVVLLSRDDMLNSRLISALSKASLTVPKLAKLPREVVNRHFEIEKIRRASYRDDEHNLRRSVSGGSGMFQLCSDEINLREEDSIREGALYDEDINNRIKSGIGMTQRKGKFYFTRILSASDLREWAGRRLPAFVQDIREWALVNKTLVATDPSASRHNATPTAQYYIEQIIQMIVSMKRDKLTDIEHDLDLAPIALAMPSASMTLSLSSDCTECGDQANACPECHSNKVALMGNEFVCDDCGNALASGNKVSLMCPNGHLHDGDLEGAIILTPKTSISNRIDKELKKIGHSWEKGVDIFSLTEGMLSLEYKQAKRLSRGDTYIMNGGQAGAFGNTPRASRVTQKAHQKN